MTELELRAMTAPRAMVESTTVQPGADTLHPGAADLALAPLPHDRTIMPALHGPTARAPTARQPRRRTVGPARHTGARR